MNQRKYHRGGRTEQERLIGALSLGCLTMLALAACNLPIAPLVAQQPVVDIQATAAMQTVAAVITLAEPTQPEPTDSPTAVPNTDTPVPTLAPSSTPTATSTPTPTATRTPIPVPCNWASFVADVTVEDGTRFSAGVEFEKIWRLKNIGTCSWSEDYDLVFSSGERMDGDSSVPLDVRVRPGETVDVSVDLTAPDKPGEYIGYWLLRDEAGRIFGIGPEAEDPFWVEIEVRHPTKVVYDFTKNYCDAVWESGAGGLACPGVETDTEGAVVYLNAPVLDGGHTENEPGLLTVPEWVDKGWITGTFPAFRVKSGDQFRAVISCQGGSSGCNVRFRLDYQIGDGKVETLDEWNEESDGVYGKVSVDLSDLAGKKVKFILSVDAKNHFEEDLALWLLPRIMR